MRIIEQGYELLPDQEDLVQQIGSRAAICYKADGDNPEANVKRVQHCLKNGHLSALELGRITTIDFNYSKMSPFIAETSYNGVRFSSGSVRAWMETGLDFDTVISMPRIEFPNINSADYMQHVHRAVKFITNRAMSHQLVRHRLCSFLQESQRYVRYDAPGGIEFIRPVWLTKDIAFDRQAVAWEKFMQNAEENYSCLLANGLTPQQARGVLPNDTKTEIIVYCSLNEWGHIFFQRVQGGADPMMKALMLPVLEEFRGLYPGMFDELKPSAMGTRL